MRLLTKEAIELAGGLRLGLIRYAAAFPFPRILGHGKVAASVQRRSGCLPAQKPGKLCLEMMLSMRRPALTPLPQKPGILAHSIIFLTQAPVRYGFTEQVEFANRGKLVGNWHTHFCTRTPRIRVKVADAQG